MSHEHNLEPGTGFEDLYAHYARKKKRVIYAMLVWSVLLGIGSCFLLDEEGPINFVFALPIIFLGIVWCHLDASQHGRRVGKVMKYALPLVFTIAFPVYLVQTRGAGGLLTLLKALVLLFALLACSIVAALITLFLGHAVGLWEFAA